MIRLAEGGDTSGAMTVRELIAALRKFDGDKVATVYTDTGDAAGVTKVRAVCLTRTTYPGVRVYHPGGEYHWREADRHSGRPLSANAVLIEE